MNIVFGLIFLILSMIWFCIACNDTSKSKFKLIADIVTACAYFILALFYIFVIKF
jgi:hypothetical protein